MKRDFPVEERLVQSLLRSSSKEASSAFKDLGLWKVLMENTRWPGAQFMEGLKQTKLEKPKDSLRPRPLNYRLINTVFMFKDDLVSLLGENGEKRG